MNTGVVCKSLGQDVYEEQLQISGVGGIKRFVDVGANNYFEAVKTGV